MVYKPEVSKNKVSEPVKVKEIVTFFIITVIDFSYVFIIKIFTLGRIYLDLFGIIIRKVADKLNLIRLVVALINPILNHNYGNDFGQVNSLSTDVYGGTLVIPSIFVIKLIKLVVNLLPIKDIGKNVGRRT